MALPNQVNCRESPETDSPIIGRFVQDLPITVLVYYHTLTILHYLHLLYII